jgi:enoyl-CoA hydratase/carnithine racemase
MSRKAYKEIRYVVDDPVAVITLNRPSSMNAFTSVTLREIRDALDRSMEDRRVVGTVITGEGKAFCAGLDATSLAEAAEQPPDMSGVPADQPALFSYIRDFPKPVIAAVNGMCAGGGFVLALMCDLRFAAEDAVFTTVFSKRGLIAEHATSWLLPRLVGSGRALDLLWSSRRVSGSEAVEMGLAERLAGSGQVAQLAIAYVRDLAESTSPQSLKITKELVNAHWSASFETAAGEGHVAMSVSLGEPDFREGVNSFLERRAPTFARIGKETE